MGPYRRKTLPTSYFPFIIESDGKAKLSGSLSEFWKQSSEFWNTKIAKIYRTQHKRKSIMSARALKICRRVLLELLASH
jgi:hypothetical protein